MGEGLFEHWKEHAGLPEKVCYTIHALYGVPCTHNANKVWEFASVFRSRYIHLHITVYYVHMLL